MGEPIYKCPHQIAKISRKSRKSIKYLQINRHSDVTFNIQMIHAINQFSISGYNREKRSKFILLFTCLYIQGNIRSSNWKLSTTSLLLFAFTPSYLVRWISERCSWKSVTKSSITKRWNRIPFWNALLSRSPSSLISPLMHPLFCLFHCG